MIKWDEKYALGIEMIDEQHKKLFEIAERAYNLLKNEFKIDKYDDIVDILKELKDYTVFHFNFEEQYMISIGYKKYLSHKVYHEDFVNTINNIDLNSIDTNQDESIMEILNFIVNWISEHILEHDKLIALYKKD
ncbi:hemerythrin [Clostridium sp. USBA 49]|jgi:hemerythrin|uniref:bacteriohemerythrin n=1 Tax=Clostridium TaxID=1485 RepID=UPI00099A44FF|nr:MULTISPECIES: bacteriohemerythrin [Clostridium]SKA78563.1 hemerythrin [Clostridium sp. USBA 49]